MEERGIVTMALTAGTIISAAIANRIAMAQEQKKVKNAPEIPTDGSESQPEQTQQFVNGVATEQQPQPQVVNYVPVDAAGRPIKMPNNQQPQPIFIPQP